MPRRHEMPGVNKQSSAFKGFHDSLTSKERVLGFPSRLLYFPSRSLTAGGARLLPGLVQTLCIGHELCRSLPTPSQGTALLVSVAVLCPMLGIQTCCPAVPPWRWFLPSLCRHRCWGSARCWGFAKGWLHLHPPMLGTAHSSPYMRPPQE